MLGFAAGEATAPVAEGMTKRSGRSLRAPSAMPPMEPVCLPACDQRRENERPAFSSRSRWMFPYLEALG
jgi:hypothetical protein